MSALCRLCGKRKCVIDLVVELKDESSQPSVSFKNIIERYCHIELDANKLLPQCVCDECKEFIDKIISFCDTTEAVQIKLKNNQRYNLKECFVKLHEIDATSATTFEFKLTEPFINSDETVKETCKERTRNENIVKQELVASDCDVEEFAGADDDSWDESEISTQPKKKHVLHAVIDKATTIDELFLDEVNGTSEIPLNHLNVPITECLENGRISKNGLRLIPELRWKDIDYSCLACGSSFDTVIDLKNHVRGNHPKKTLMNCSSCMFGEARTIISYLNHLMTKHHEHLRFCCFVCSEIFYDVSALWKHVTEEHKDIASKMVPCFICGQYNETFRMLKAHKVTHVTHENVESFITFKKNYAPQLEENIVDCPYNMALADCDKNADGSVSSNCVTKYSSWNEIILKCHECSAEPMVLPEFHLHCERDHSDTIGSKYFCEKCPAEAFSRMCSFLYHNISHHDQQLKFCCVTCSQMFWNLTALYRHYRVCHPNFKIWMCLICGYHSFSYQRLNMHTASVHGIGKKKQMKLEKLKSIQNKTKSAIKPSLPILMDQKLKQNRRRTIVPDKLPHNIKTTEELFKPELNGTSPHSLVHLNTSKDHVAVDGTVTDAGLINISPIRWSDISYRCAECQDIFGTVLSLRDHVYKTHKTTCNLECSICPNGKSRMVHGFVNHVTTKHYEHLKFCCIICSIMFYDIKTLWKHVYQDHRMKRELISPCLICGTIAKTLKFVKQHKMAHLNQETMDTQQDFNNFFAKELNGVMMESKYNLAIPDSDKNDDGTVKEEASVKWNKWNAITQKCLHCPTEPMSLPDYYLHLEAHHPELRGIKFTCEECPTKEFSAINAFLIHNIKRHGTHLSYCCIVCSQLFWNYTALHRHHSECHPAFNRCICLYCGHQFSKVYKVNEHTTSMHGMKKTADGEVIEMTLVAYKARARIGVKRREKIKSLMLPGNSDNDDDVRDTLNVFHNNIIMKQEHENLEEDEVMDIKEVLIEEILPAETEESLELLDDVEKDMTEDDVESIAGDKEWDSFSSDGSEEFKPPAKKTKVFRGRILKIPKTIKDVKTFEQLFEEEFNGTSSIPQSAHINIRAIYQTDNGEIMPEGLEEIGAQRWQDFTFQCIKCDTKSSSMFELKEHSKKKHPEVKFPLSCPGCPKSTFNDIPSLINHLTLRHYEHLKFCCLICSKLFYDIKSLWNHYQLNKADHKVPNIYPCLCCGAYKVSLKEINLHKLEHSDNQTRMEKYREFYAAEYNGVMAESLFNLVLPADEMNDDGSVTKQCEDRYAKWNSMTIYCDVCKESFCSAFELHLHYLNVHPEAKQSFNCITCVDKNFISILRLVSHVHVTHQSYLRYCCIVCSKMFWNFLALHNHYQDCHQCYSTWICLYCGRHSNDVVRVTAHLRYHKNNVVINGEKKYRCNNCSKIFEHLESYNAHGCPKEKMREALRKTAKNVSHICEVCGEGFPGPRALDNHVLTHVEDTKGTNLVECEVCHAKLKNKWTLKQHMVKHSKVKPFKCDICDMSFHHKSTRDRHMMVHTGARPHACLHCDKKFAAKFDLTIHTRLHTGEMNHECTMCDDRYPSWSNLYKHAKSKHNLDIRSDTHKKNSMLLKYDSDSE
ncbi:unnamed protein product [Diamesa tonsa]